MRFGWDPHKAQSNRREHDVSFDEAAERFADSLAMILTDHRHPDRLILIGSMASRLLFTVYAERDADVIRIISARKATRAERKNMKKASSRAIEPSVMSVREMPEIDFRRYQVQKNPYAAVIAREGISVVHNEPSPRSLAELPEVDFSHVQTRRSAYAGRARRAVLQLKAGRGRPRRGQEAGPTPARSIRLPMTVWEALEAAARDAGTTVHALLRLAVTDLLEKPPFMDHLHAAAGSGRRGQRSASRTRPTPERNAPARRRAERRRPRR